MAKVDTRGGGSMRAGVRVVGWGVLLVVVLTGCGSRRPSPAATTPTLTVPSSPVASVDPRAAAVQNAVAAYRNMWQAYDAAAAIPDPGFVDLARYAAGDALKTMVSGLQSLKVRGLKGTGSVTVSPKVTEVSPVAAPNHVSITDCLNDAGSHVVRSGPGPAYSDSPGGRHLTVADVQLQADGSWKVTGFGVRAAGSCKVVVG